jgi:hypothetical protein
LVIAYSFRFKTTSGPTRRVRGDCATDHARILNVGNRARLGFNADRPEIDGAQDHTLAVDTENSAGKLK